MALYKIPYGTTHMPVDIPATRLVAVLEPGNLLKTPHPDESLTVKEALENPISSPRLRDIARNRNKVLLVTSDHTRPMPSKITLPLLLEEIRQGSKDAEIIILIATGYHRPTTRSEMTDKFGDLTEKETIINHDCRDKAKLVFKGILPSGGELWLNSLIDWADLIVAEGFIEPHFFAGFSGGRKSILPGIAGEKTVLANHCSQFIAHKCARTGILANNPLHKDMIFAAEQVHLEFILNVTLDKDKRISKAFAGHYQGAHEQGCSQVKGECSFSEAVADIVITSNGGYPLDQNIYQAVKGMTAAESCVKPGGVIIMAAACSDGHGSESFYRWMADSPSPQDVWDQINRIPQNETMPDQWEAQVLARVLLKAKVILVTDESNKALAESMHMTYAGSLQRALQMAEDMTGKDSTVTVIPDGVAVIFAAH